MESREGLVGVVGWVGIEVWKGTHLPNLPNLFIDIIRCQTTQDFLQTAVKHLTDAIVAAQYDGKTATIGLSGGSTPKPIYEKLSSEKKIDWKRVQFFLLDERYVLADHADSNTKMIRDTLLKNSAVDASFLFPDTNLPLEDCVSDYNQKISVLHPDLLILGMGPDGHIASLFPPVSSEAFGPASVIHTETDLFAVHDRISVTFPVLEAATKRVFLITGAEKYSLLQKMQDGNQDASLFPASALMDERTTWVVGP